jgi:chorismate synthase
MSNTLGKLFTVTSFGESHGKCIGVVVDGCPAGLSLSMADVQKELDLRRASFSPASTSRREKDKVEILSGIFNGRATGAPICLVVKNEDVDDSAYERIKNLLRPGHADFTAYIKYGGFNDWRGGGIFSGRITAGFVMAGAIAKKILSTISVETLAHTVAIGDIVADSIPYEQAKKKALKDPLFCADAAASKKMLATINAVRKAGDSLGGVIEGVALNLPVGLGEPLFDTLDGELAKALFAIPAVKGVEFGGGFAAERGSENNDPFTVKDGKIVTTTNNAGGILGGISNGMPLVVRVAVKPTSSISLEQKTVDIYTKKETTIKIGGRHDACIVTRAVPVVSAMMAVVLCDFAMRAGSIPRVV